MERIDFMSNYNTEIWKDVVGYEGYYQVSNLGNVRSCDRSVLALNKYGNETPRNLRGSEMILRENKKDPGRKVVKLCKDGKTKQFKVHRLVAFAFLGYDFFDGAEVNHIDENPSNNRLENLEWVTRKENVNWGTRTERSQMKRVPKLWKPVALIDIETGAVIKEYISVTEAADDSDVTKVAVSRSARFNRIYKGKLLWKFV